MAENAGGAKPLGCLVVHGISDVKPGATARQVAMIAAGSNTVEAEQVALKGGIVGHLFHTTVDEQPVVFIDGAWGDLSAVPANPLGALWVIWRQAVRIPALAVREAKLAGKTPHARLLMVLAYTQAVLLPPLLLGLVLTALVLCVPLLAPFASVLLAGVLTWAGVERFAPRWAIPGLFLSLAVSATTSAAWWALTLDWRPTTDTYLHYATLVALLALLVSTCGSAALIAHDWFVSTAYYEGPFETTPVWKSGGASFPPENGEPLQEAAEFQRNQDRKFGAAGVAMLVAILWLGIAPKMQIDCPSEAVSTENPICAQLAGLQESRFPPQQLAKPTDPPWRPLAEGRYALAVSAPWSYDPGDAPRLSETEATGHGAVDLAVGDPTMLDDRIFVAAHTIWVQLDWMVALYWTLTMSLVVLTLVTAIKWSPVAVVAAVLPGFATFAAAYFVLIGVVGALGPTDQRVYTNLHEYAVVRVYTTHGGNQQAALLYSGRCDDPVDGACMIREAAPTELPIAPLGPIDLAALVVLSFLIGLMLLIIGINALPGLLADVLSAPKPKPKPDSDGSSTGAVPTDSTLLPSWWSAAGNASPGRVLLGRRLDRLIAKGPAYGVAMLQLALILLFLLWVAESLDLLRLGLWFPYVAGVLALLETFAALAAMSSLAVLSAARTPIDLIRDVVRFFDHGQADFVQHVRSRQVELIKAARVHSVVIVAHSQGTLVAAHLVTEPHKDAELPPIVGWSTFGSPLHSIYEQWLPNVAKRAVEATGKDRENNRVPLLANCFFNSDYVGRAFDIQGKDKALGYGGHTRYFDTHPASNLEVQTSIQALIAHGRCPAHGRCSEE